MNYIKYRDEFPKLLNELNLNGNGIEIGVANGKFSKVLLTSNISKFYLLDAWREFPKELYQDKSNCPQVEQDKRYEFVVNEMKSYGDRVVIIRDDCHNACNVFSDGHFDFIYIDANHDYEYIKRDMHDWYSKLRSGGIFAGHDYMDGIRHTGKYGVKTAVGEFCSNLKIVPIITKGTRRIPPSWYFMKP
ncbi:MAG: class I SAM-dependent methyltransferase [Methanomassiliicoccales archaeon]|jgi:hypothetical protein